MNITYLYTFLAVVAGWIVTLLIKNYWPSYFNTKGTNQATKEDIEEITTKVEEVKQIFTKEAEAVKANLQILNNIQIGITSEERNSIIDVHIAYHRYLNYFLDFSMGDIDRNSIGEINKWMKGVNELSRSLHDHVSKFELFIDDAKVLQGFRDLNIKTIPLQAIISKTGFAMLAVAQNREYANKTLTGAVKSDEIKKLYATLADILDVHRKSMLAEYEAIMPLIRKFQDESRRYLKRMLE